MAEYKFNINRNASSIKLEIESARVDFRHNALTCEVWLDGPLGETQGRSPAFSTAELMQAASDAGVDVPVFMASFKSIIEQSIKNRFEN